MNQLIFRSFKAHGFWLECPPSPAAAMHCGVSVFLARRDLRRPQLAPHSRARPPVSPPDSSESAPQSRTPAR